MSEKRVVVAASRAELAELVADKFIIRIRKTVKRQGGANVFLTGGGIAQDVHRQIALHPTRNSVDWSAVHFWWGDERFLPHGDPERNHTQALNDVLGPLGVPEANIHPMPAADTGASVDDAARRYADELAAHAGEKGPWPDIDVAFVGVGPDGHVLSVFPGSTHAANTEAEVVGVTDSPKPPPERVSVTIPLMNQSRRVWMVAAGSDKASATGLALANAGVVEVPAAGISGVQSTKVFIDADVAAGVPDELVERQRFWSAGDERADYVPNALR